MRKISLGLCLALNLASIAHAGKAIDPVQVTPVVPYAAGTESAALAVNDACHWNSQVISTLVKETKGQAQVTEQDFNAVQGRKLVLIASNSTEAGPASEASPRWLAVSGQLLDQSGLVGDFEFRREATKSSLQDCKVVKDLSQDLGSDIADWLKDPMRRVSVAPAMSALNKESMDSLDKDCPWDTFLPNYLKEESHGLVGVVAQNFSAVKTRKLSLTVVESRIAGGGLYSGAKWIDLKGQLLEGEKVVGSFDASRHTIKGWKSCGVAKSLCEDIGEDIVKWLKAPSLNAKLGDAK